MNTQQEEAIVSRYDKFISHLANDWQKHRVSFEDLQQEGRLAVLSTVRELPNARSSDVDLMVRVAVRRAISRYVRENAHLIRPSQTLNITRRYVFERRAQLERLYGRRVDAAEIYESFCQNPPRIKGDRLRQGQELNSKVWTLGMIHVALETENMFTEYTEGDSDEDAFLAFPGERFEQTIIERESLQQVLSLLSERDVRILWYWADGRLPFEIARLMGMAEKTVSTYIWRSRLQAQAIAKSLDLWGGGTGKRLVNRGTGDRAGGKANSKKKRTASMPAYTLVEVVALLLILCLLFATICAPLMAAYRYVHRQAHSIQQRYSVPIG